MDTSFSFVNKFFGSGDLTTSLIEFGLKLLSALVVLAIGTILIRMIMSVLRSTVTRTVRDHTVRSYIQSTTRIFLWIILIIMLLGVFGVETAALAALVGAAGLAIGLALQGSLSNFAAGVMLLIFRPFRAGDQVEVATVVGSVIEIGIFSTVIDTPENVRAFVPNSSIFSGVIKNRSINEFLRVELKLTVDNASDITKAQQIIHRILVANDMVLDTPQPEVQIIEDPAAGLTIAVRPYTKLHNLESVRTMLSKSIREELRAADITVVK